MRVRRTDLPIVNNILFYAFWMLSFFVVCIYVEACAAHILLFLGLKNTAVKDLNVKTGYFNCPNCNKVYTHKKTLSRHIRQECGVEPELQCPYCPYRARRAYVLASHIKSHALYANPLMQ